jgi:hypothetical protein
MYVVVGFDLGAGGTGLFAPTSVRSR